MKKSIYLLVLISILISCTNQEGKTKLNAEELSVNALIPTKVIVYNEVNFLEQSIPEWTNGVDTARMKDLNQKVIDSDLELYSSMVYYTPDSKTLMTDKDILDNMNDKGTISALYFIESWDFDQKKYFLQKNVESWSPVYEFYKKNKEGLVDSTKKAKKLLYDVRESSTNNEKLIAENITYEVSLSKDFKTNEYLDLTKFTHLIVDPVLSGKKQAYDFFENTELTPIEVKYIFGYSVDSLEEEDPVTGEWVKRVEIMEEDLSEVEAFIFVEDWFLDTKTFAIRKQVKAIAPVLFQVRIDDEGEAYESKKIAFLVKM